MDGDKQKVIPGRIEFGETSLEYDELSGSLGEGEKGQIASADDPADYKTRNMMELSEILKIEFRTVYMDNNSTNPTACKINVEEIYEGLHNIQLIKYDFNTYKINLEEYPVRLLKKILEKKYGKELADTGIYEDIGLDDKLSTIRIDKLKDYFQNEISELLTLNKCFLRYSDMISKAYVQLLTFHHQARPFFKGATDEMLRRDSSLTTRFSAIELIDILNYAKKVDEVKKVKEYFNMYQALKNKL